MTKLTTSTSRKWWRKTWRILTEAIALWTYLKSTYWPIQAPLGTIVVVQKVGSTLKGACLFRETNDDQHIKFVLLDPATKSFSWLPNVSQIIYPLKTDSLCMHHCLGRWRLSTGPRIQIFCWQSAGSIKTVLVRKDGPRTPKVSRYVQNGVCTVQKYILLPSIQCKDIDALDIGYVKAGYWDLCEVHKNRYFPGHWKQSRLQAISTYYWLNMEITQ